MAGSRKSLPTYQQVFGQDESDDDLDHDAKLRTSVDIQRSAEHRTDQRDEGEQLLTGRGGNPWREEGIYNPVQDGAHHNSRPGAHAEGVHTPEERYSSERESLELEFEQEKAGYVPPRQPSSITRFFKRYVLPTSLSVLFIVIAYGAWQASKGHFIPGQSQNQTLGLAQGTINGTFQPQNHTPAPAQQTQEDEIQSPPKLLGNSKYRSNGSALFAPTTILISLDGFRADFLQRGLTPTLNEFISQGVSPKYMTPSFPSVTFPNHFTMVTGLYPESHGVVGNTFYDPELQEEFSYHDPSHSMQPQWWKGDPLWLTAERQGVRTATHMWPGSEAHIGELEPSFVDKYNGTEDLDRKVQRILEYMDKPGMEDPTAIDQRPQLVLAYVPNVDADGHHYGPNSTEITNTILAVDTMLLSLLDGLKARNLTDIVNLVVVSDHGMATTSVDRLIQLEDVVDTSMIAHLEGWPHRGLRLKDDDPEVLEMLYNRLLTETAHRDGFDVYLRDKTMPERFHFSNNSRIAPLWLVTKTGWAIVTMDDMDVHQAQLNGDVYPLRGMHGYDNEHPLMRAIFVAKGPAFPHESNSRIDVFQNTEVYNIVCDSIGIEPTANNGTLRLPFKPLGLHSDFDDVEEDKGLAADPPMTSFIPQVSTIWKQLANATVGSDDLNFIHPTPTSAAESYWSHGLDFHTPRPTGLDEYNNDYDYEDEQDNESWASGVRPGQITQSPSATPFPAHGGLLDELKNINDGFYGSSAAASNSQISEVVASVIDVLAMGTATPSSNPTSVAVPSMLFSKPTITSAVAASSASPQYASPNDAEAPLDFEPTRPIMDDTDSDSDDEDEKKSWLDWFGDKYGDAKDWLSGLIGGKSGNEDDVA